MGGLDTNGTYIVTALDLYQAMGGNYSVTYTWIVGLRDQYTNQTLVNSCQLLVCVDTQQIILVLVVPNCR